MVQIPVNELAGVRVVGGIIFPQEQLALYFWVLAKEKGLKKNRKN